MEIVGTARPAWNGGGRGLRAGEGARPTAKAGFVPGLHSWAGDHDVLGLPLAMNDAGRVCGCDAAGDLRCQVEQLPDGHWAAGYQFAERLALYEFRDDVRMIQCASGLGLLDETRCGFSSAVGGKIGIATSRDRREPEARNTCPMPPAPSVTTPPRNHPGGKRGPWDACRRRDTSSATLP